MARRNWGRLLLTFVTVFTVAAASPLSFSVQANTPGQSAQARDDIWDLAELVREPSYAEVLEDYARAGYKDVPRFDLRLDATQYAASEGSGVSVGAAPSGRTGNALFWTGEESWIEWEVTVPTAGLYQMEMEFLPLDGKRASIQRDIQVNGAYPFFEAKRIAFTRQWLDAGAPTFDNRGDHMRPRQLEVREWRVSAFQDAGGMYREPFRFYLQQGTNRIRMNAIREPMAITYIRVHTPVVCPHTPTWNRSMRPEGIRPFPSSW